MADFENAARMAAQKTQPYDFGKCYHVGLGKEAVAASTAYLLIDMDDPITFPHHDPQANPSEIILKSLRIDLEKDSDGIYDIWIGVVEVAGLLTGQARCIHVFHSEASFNATDDNDKFAGQIDWHSGLNCKVASGSMVYMLSDQTVGGTADWNGATYHACPSGATVIPEVGDVVVWVEEVSGSGTIDFFISADYDVR